MKLEELRDELAKAHNYVSELAVANGSDYYGGQRDVLVRVLYRLNTIIESEKANA